MTNNFGSSSQLPLFQLSPRDRGKEKVDWSKGGIKSLKIEKFKTFSEFEIEFGKITLLVGGNNSGKTSLLQAIRLIYWCIQQCGRIENEQVIFKKHVIPFAEFKLIPSHDLRDLVFRGVTPNTRKRGIKLEIELSSGRQLRFQIYNAYNILMAVEPVSPTPSEISLQEFEVINRSPLYIPGFFGVVSDELLELDARLEVLLSSGHQNEVLRNIILRLRENDDRFAKLQEILKTEFGIRSIDAPFSPLDTEFLRTNYYEEGTRIPLDLVSAGSGFLQVLQILAHSLQNPSPILLLDEPDAHMHSALQRSFLEILRDLARNEQLQIIMASHSETFLRELSLEDIRVIDSSRNSAAMIENPAILQEKLSEAGIWPDHLELAEILRTRRVILLEGDEDRKSLDILGRQINPQWDSRRKLIQVVNTEGSSHTTTVSRLKYVTDILQGILPDGIKIAHVRDRDLLTDEGYELLINGTQEHDLKLFISENRNRESYLVSPHVIANALFKYSLDKLPDDLKDITKLEEWCKIEILDWCKENIDELPSKVREYNFHWMRNEFGSDFHNAQKREDRYIRKEWTVPINDDRIPWKFIDGKSVLSRLRHKLEDNQIFLPESQLLSVMSHDDFGDSLNKVVEIILEWTE